MKPNASMLRAGGARWLPPLFFAAVALGTRPVIFTHLFVPSTRAASSMAAIAGREYAQVQWAAFDRHPALVQGGVRGAGSGRLASALTAQAPVVRSAAAVALFHRPIEETPLATGRRFHRAWLRMQTLGLSAAPMAVLADNDTAAAIVRPGFGIPPQRKLMTALRMGVVPQPPAGPQARLAVAALIA